MGKAFYKVAVPSIKSNGRKLEYFRSGIMQVHNFLLFLFFFVVVFILFYFSPLFSFIWCFFLGVSLWVFNFIYLFVSCHW